LGKLFPVHLFPLSRGSSLRKVITSRIRFWSSW